MTTRCRASRAVPSGCAESITRTTAFRSLPSSASAWNSTMLPPAGTSIVNDTRARRSRNHRARSRFRRDSCQRPARAATSGGRTERRDCVERMGPAAPRPPAGCAGSRRRASGSSPGAPRPGTGRRAVTTRGFRQMTTGVALVPGATSVKRICTFWGPGVAGAPRPRPPRPPTPYVKRCAGSTFSVSSSNASGLSSPAPPAARSPRAKNQLGQVVRDFWISSQPARPLASDALMSDVGAGSVRPADSPSRASDTRCSACSPPSRCGRQSGR